MCQASYAMITPPARRPTPRPRAAAGRGRRGGRHGQDAGSRSPKPIAKTDPARTRPDGIGRSGRSLRVALAVEGVVQVHAAGVEERERGQRGRSGGPGPRPAPASVAAASVFVQTVGRFDTRPSRRYGGQTVSEHVGPVGVATLAKPLKAVKVRRRAGRGPSAARAPRRPRCPLAAVRLGQHVPRIGLDLECGVVGLVA